MKRKGWYGLIVLAMWFGLIVPAAWAGHSESWPTPVPPAGRYATWLGRTQFIMELSERGTYEVLQANSVYIEGRYAIVGYEIVFSETQGPGACAPAVDPIARYAWSYHLSELQFFVISESCQSQQMVMTAGRWIPLP